MSLDGKPLPNNVRRGKEVIDWQRDYQLTMNQLVNATEKWQKAMEGLKKRRAA